jgi:hypothetical protein
MLSHPSIWNDSSCKDEFFGDDIGLEQFSWKSCEKLHNVVSA